MQRIVANDGWTDAGPCEALAGCICSEPRLPWWVPIVGVLWSMLMWLHDCNPKWVPEEFRSDGSNPPALCRGLQRWLGLRW